MAPVSACVRRRRGARPWHTWAIVCGRCLGVAESSWGPEGGQDGDRHSWKSGRRAWSAAGKAPRRPLPSGCRCDYRVRWVKQVLRICPSRIFPAPLP